MSFVSDTLHLLKRHIMTTVRLPIWLAVTLIQPIIWLGLFGELFQKVVQLKGFGSDNYIQFLTPGIIVMTALFGSFWAGMGIVEDYNDGVIDRLLATPVHRGAVIASRVLHSMLTVLVQSFIILCLGLILGSGLPGGVAGGLAILGISALMGAGFAAISNGFALITRQQDTLVAVVQFFAMPLTFLSSAFLATAVMPGWIRSVARFNPVNWTVDSSRDAMLGQHWVSIGTDALFLAAFLVVCAIFATQCFRVYRKTT